MIAFWVAAGLLSALAAGLILLRAAEAARHGPVADPAMAVYRRQLSEIDDLAARGLIPEGERRSAHAEAGRRLLAAADHRTAAWVSGSRAGAPVALAAGLACAAAVGLYFLTGAPGLPDMPFHKRLEAWRHADPRTLNAPEMAAVLDAFTRTRPNDPEAYRYLAMAEGASGDPAAAARALRRAVRLAPQRADLWEMLGEALVMESGGDEPPEAQSAFREALKRDPKLVSARFHLGQARIQGGDRAGGLADWKALLVDLPQGDPHRDALQTAIAEAEKAPAPPAMGGDQLAMVRGMVEGLAQRLQAQPDDAAGWVRLVRSYAVLGDTAKRDAALRQAKARYAGRPDVVSDLEAAARTEPMR